MIELRWLVKLHDEPVLQYRVLREVYVITSEKPPLVQAKPYMEWSPWEDVKSERLV